MSAVCIGGTNGHGECVGHGPPCPYCTVDGVPSPLLSAIRPGDAVECTDAWDTFNNLTVGQRYEVIDTIDGMIFVWGNQGHLGGWSPWHFKLMARGEDADPYSAFAYRGGNP